MSIRTYKIIIAIGYSIILGIMGIETACHFNLGELFRFILFWVFLTTLMYTAHRNAKGVNETPSKDNNDFLSVNKVNLSEVWHLCSEVRPKNVSNDNPIVVIWEKEIYGHTSTSIIRTQKHSELVFTQTVLEPYMRWAYLNDLLP